MPYNVGCERTDMVYMMRARLHMSGYRPALLEDRIPVPQGLTPRMEELLEALERREAEERVERPVPIDS